MCTIWSIEMDGKMPETETESRWSNILTVIGFGSMDFWFVSLTFFLAKRFEVENVKNGSKNHSKVSVIYEANCRIIIFFPSNHNN